MKHEDLFPQTNSPCSRTSFLPRRIHHHHHGGGRVFGAMNTMYAAVQRTREIATLLCSGSACSR
jgi:hypothetical protein